MLINKFLLIQLWKQELMEQMQEQTSRQTFRNTNESRDTHKSSTNTQELTSKSLKAYYITEQGTQNSSGKEMFIQINDKIINEHKII